MADFSYLGRHGRADANPVDRDRVLTADGRRRVTALAEALHGRWSVRRIVTSPYARARQTAELHGEFLGVAVVVEPALASGLSGGAGLLALVREAGPGVLFIGHNPEVAEALGLVAGGSVGVPPGTVAALRWEGARFALAWARDA